MSVAVTPFFGFILSAALCLGYAWTAAGQDVQIRTIEEGEDGIVVEVSANWAQPMRAVLDSTGIARFDFRAARALTFGVLDASDTYELPSLAPPIVSVLGSEFDEIRLPQAADTSGWFATYTGELVGAVGLGISRKVPLVSIVARLLTYEAETGTVRRYRRIRVALRYGAAPSKLLAGASGTNPHLDVTTSILAGGTLFKIPITAEGIYRIDRAFLSSLPGVSPDNVDPAKIKIYGNGGTPVPAANRAPRPADLVENPVYRSGGGDGRFDTGDVILFYGKGPRGWHAGADGQWEHYVHPFSNENYYFLKIGDDTDGLTVGADAFPGFGDAETVSEVTGRYFRDFDEFMWSKENGTGHTWVSRTIRPGTTREILENVALPGFQGSSVEVRARVAIRSNPVATLLFESNGSLVAQERARRTVTSDETSSVAAPSVASFSMAHAQGAAVRLAMRLSPTATNAPEAAIDWIRVFYPQALTASGDSLRFTTPVGRTGRFEMVLGGFSAEPQVWDVTEHHAIRRLGVRPEGGAYRIQVEAGDRPRELFAFTPAIARAVPAGNAQPLPNQNLHGLASLPEFLIVAPDALFGPAQELAEYRREQGMEVLVTDVTKIYNEFSGGMQDISGLRDYFRFLYDRAPTDGSRLRYVLLFGDGHFNYRNLGDEAQKPVLQSWIPPYETEESFDPNSSYTSDDWFALLDENEGEWAWPGTQGYSSERVDVGIGRFPVQTVDEGAAIVRKIKEYESPSTYGAWRNRYLFVADDDFNGIRAVQENPPDLHTQNADVVAELVAREYPLVNIRKVYGISYSRDFVGGWRLPAVERDIQAALNEGVLVMNYSGHGGEFGLAQEEIFTAADAAALRNSDRLPIFITATCSFGWWDLSKEQSGAEVLLLNPTGGAIALLTTVRLVYTWSSIHDLNVGLNRALNSEMFKKDENGLARRLGDVLWSTKNQSAGYQGNNRKFNLLGDPTLRIGTTSRETAIETVNGIPLENIPRLRALDEVTVTGSVRGLNGEVDAGFDGKVNLSVFDAERKVQLREQKVMPRPYYSIREDLIWRGVVPVSGGHFEATFVVPKDISYSDQPGRISAYAMNATAHAGGFTESVIVGGTSDNPPNDAAGPEISLFLNDTTFVSGGLTPPKPKLIVKLSDESGINAVGAGVGHEMLLVVDGDEQQAVDISGRFESDPNSYRSGRVTFSFDEYPVTLEDGPHSLSVRAWDVVNNSSTSVIDFFVSSANDLVLRNIYNYPNPTSGRTRFIFEHNQPTGTSADVQVRIYTLAGRPIRTIDAEEALPAGVLTAGPVQVAWDGRDEDFNPLASGIYLYKIRVAVEGLDGERHVSEQIEKLAIIH